MGRDTLCREGSVKCQLTPEISVYSKKNLSYKVDHKLSLSATFAEENNLKICCKATDIPVSPLASSQTLCFTGKNKVFNTALSHAVPLRQNILWVV